MPELPEVERARKLIETTCTGYYISSVETKEDKLVFTDGIDHEDLPKALNGRTIQGCSRHGKMFWINLSGDGPVPVMHFGMNGMLMLKGREPDWYIRRPKRAKESQAVWPPKYLKFMLKLLPQDGSIGDEPIELAFVDSRRFSRIRLLPSPPSQHPPLSALGFDPLLSPPSLDTFTSLLSKRSGAVKSVLLDQSFSAGVGNWVADEILYQAGVHPGCPVKKLSDEKVEKIWRMMIEVCRIAVEVDANHAKFPEDWLFSWRWSKGKKDKRLKGLDGSLGMRLPNGEPATISFVTVGGRTSAFVQEVQRLPEGVEMKIKVSRKKAKKGSSPCDEDSELSSPPIESGDETIKLVSDHSLDGVRRPRRKRGAVVKDDVEEEAVKEKLVVGRGSKRKSITQIDTTTVTDGKTSKHFKPTVSKSDLSPPPSSKKRHNLGRASDGTVRGIKREVSSELSDAPDG